MTDKELLELAAKAAGYEGVITEYQNGYCEMGLTNHFKLDGSNAWSPLNNDGDALRLAAKLGITINPGGIKTVATWWVRPEMIEIDHVVELHNGDLYAATRRAIVRAAAAIGEQAQHQTTQHKLPEGLGLQLLIKNTLGEQS